jgi:hypothetical protein
MTEYSQIAPANFCLNAILAPLEASWRDTKSSIAKGHVMDLADSRASNGALVSMLLKRRMWLWA